MRLIDADELIKQFHYGGIADTEEDKAWTATVRRTIKAQPTAYDIDKIVKQLEGEATLSDVDGIGKCYAIDLQTAVIIVTKGGGTDE